MIPGFFGEAGSWFIILQTLSMLLFILLIFFFPKLMFWQADRKMRNTLIDLETYRDDAETMFLNKLSNGIDKSTQQKFETLKDFKFSAPTGIDPAGLVGKLENVLDASENKFDRFIERNAETEDPEELADLQMAFKGVMGTHQIYKVTRHFRELITKTRNIQLIGLIQMMLPVYQELAESQREATRAFVDQAPIGDAIGPLVAAKLIEEDSEEIAEDIVHSEEEIKGNKVHVIKSNGPGARLGKYGNALDSLAEENSLEAVITVDAGAKLEGEKTGALSEGVGVMMGGPGVEKSKIEDVAAEHELPLEGLIIKQSPAEASKPMKKKIYDSYKPAVKKVEQLVEEIDGEVAVVGVGNTCGVANKREDVKAVHNRLRKYWKEYEEQEEEEVSYIGMLGAMPNSGDQSQLREIRNSILWRIPR